jgi:hypothetical protein
MGTWLAEGRHVSLNAPKISVRARSGTMVARRVVDRLGEDTVRELIEARRAGAKLRALTEQYEVSESSVKRLLRAAEQSPTR